MQITIPIGIGLFLILYLYNSFSDEQLAETKSYFSKANYSYVILAVILNFFSHLTRAVRWNLMLEPMGYRAKLANNFMAISVAYLFNLLIPRSGEVSRAIVLDKYEKVPFQKGFGSIISERIVDLFFLMSFTSLALILEYETLYDYLLNLFSSGFLRKLLVLFLVIAIAAGSYIYFSRKRINQKVRTFVSGLKEGLLCVLRMRRKSAFIFQSFLIWILYVSAFYVAVQALSETSALPLGTVIIAFVVGGLTITFTNSGFGSYPFAMAAVLSIFGISKTIGVTFGWIVWISNTLTSILLGVLSLIFLPVYNKKS